jgi:muramoyltetrapeptide carboxypeptidase
MKRKAPAKPWGAGKLRVLSRIPAPGVTGEMVGGNLTVWASVLGTSFAGKGFGKILFFEDIGEKLYRLDRTLTQIELAGGLQGAHAIILGDYLDCDDSVAQGLKKLPKPGAAREQAIHAPAAKDLAPLRPVLEAKKTIAQIFLEAAERNEIPLVAGLPVGHGPGRFSLPLGARYELRPNGSLRVLDWSWLK